MSLVFLAGSHPSFKNRYSKLFSALPPITSRLSTFVDIVKSEFTPLGTCEGAFSSTKLYLTALSGLGVELSSSRHLFLPLFPFKLLLETVILGVLQHFIVLLHLCSVSGAMRREARELPLAEWLQQRYFMVRCCLGLFWMPFVSLLFWNVPIYISKGQFYQET